MTKDIKPDVILEFADGRIEEASLVGEFIPEQNTINVIWAKTGTKHTFFLNQLCCIRMKRKAAAGLAGKKLAHEQVVTVCGKNYLVAVLEDSERKTGFYGVSTDAGEPFGLLFFPAGNIKNRQQERPVGQMLRDEGVLTPRALEETLEEQRILREKKLGRIIEEKDDLPREEIERVIEDAYKVGKVSARMRVGDILIEAGLVTREQVEDALSEQEVGKRKKIGSMLVEKGLISEIQLLTVLAVKFFLRFVDLDTIVPTTAALNALPAEVVYGLRVLPLDDDGQRLVVATLDPADYTIPDTLRFYTKRKIELVVALSTQIEVAIAKYYPKKTFEIEEIIGGMTECLVTEGETEEIAEVTESDSQIVQLVNKILLDGHRKGASDIHFEPGYRDDPFQVRYRVDGVCQVAHQVPKTYRRAILSRIKIMSGLDISERRKPQSGKIVVWQDANQIEYRVETAPTVGGNEDAVLRILTSAEPFPLDKMDFSPMNLETMKEMLSQPYGLILCVGPTGSGKTTTLHSALKYINTPDVKIWTVEDPVEITQKGLRQVQVQTKIGLTFQEALRSFLRLDPDVIMVGEMRDEETVKTVIEASLTGHLVLSTLHTNSASETVVRLIDMGMDPFNFADALLGILAQRLARRLCGCRRPYHPDKEEYDRLVEVYDPQWFRMHDGPAYSQDLTLMHRTGCETCNYTGYKGRVALHELLVNTDVMKKLIGHRASVEQLLGAAMAVGMRTLLMDGVQKVLQGLTDLSEILQVCRYAKKPAQFEDVRGGQGPSELFKTA
jgi:type II secretory ATPase GspE/PulE/Tfp pilus assembly ATPase PilB-like protein